MICGRCGCVNMDGVAFCAQCGAPMPMGGAPMPMGGAPMPMSAAPAPKKSKLPIVLLAVFCGIFAIAAIVEFVMIKGRDKTIESCYTQIDDLQEEKTSLTARLTTLNAQVEEMEDSLYFYETYAGVVYDTNGIYYHVYGCPQTNKNDSFNIFNTKLAENKGYYECPYCH